MCLCSGNRLFGKYIFLVYYLNSYVEKNELYNVECKDIQIEVVIRSIEIIVLRKCGMMTKRITENKVIDITQINYLE